MAMLSKKYLYTSQNVPRTTSLIVEFNTKADVDPIFTVSAIREGYISLQKLFIEYTIDDPTEVVFAETVFGEISYWMTLREANRLKPYLEEWRAIADLYRKQRSFKVLVDEVKTDGKYSFQAAKYLIEEPWKPNTKAQRQATQKTTEKAYTSSGVADDVKRLKEEGYIQ